MKKISRVLSFLFSALFAVVFAFSAWCGWMLQYSIQNYFTLQEKFSWMGSSPGDWEARFQTWSAVALGYVAPVLFLLLIGSLILAKRSWKSMICHLFFTFERRIFPDFSHPVLFGSFSQEYLYFSVPNFFLSSCRPFGGELERRRRSDADCAAGPGGGWVVCIGHGAEKAATIVEKSPRRKTSAGGFSVWIYSFPTMGRGSGSMVSVRCIPSMKARYSSLVMGAL